MKKLLALVCLCLASFGAQPTLQEDSNARVVERDWISRFSDDESRLQRSSNIAAQLQAHPQGSEEWMAAIEAVVSTEPDLVVQAALRMGLADHYRQRGRLSRNIARLTETWHSLQNPQSDSERRLADYALSQLVFSLSCVGRIDDLQQVFKDTYGRTFANEGDLQIYNRAKEAFLVMRGHPGIAYRCGTAALFEVGKVLGADPTKLNSLNHEDSPLGGFTLSRLTEISKGIGMNMVPISIGPNAPIPVPSVVHWKSDHYAAIKRMENDVYEVVDHTLSLHIYMSEAEIRDESTGHFLVASDVAQPKGWTTLSEADALAVVGRGYYNMLNDGKDFGCNNIANGGMCPPCKGMADWFISEPYINIWAKDTPFFYETTDGQIEFSLSFHQHDPRETDWLPTASYPTYPKWLNNWIGYVKFVAKGALYQPPSIYPFLYGYNAKVYMPDGGTLYFEDDRRFDAESGYYFSPIYPQNGTGGHLDITKNVVGFKLSHPDGSVYIFDGPYDDQSDRNFNRLARLSKMIDPKGRTNSILWGFKTNSLNTVKSVIVSIVDYDGKTNTFSYDDGHRLQQVQSPYGATATLGYDGNGRLSSITDAEGLVSMFKYGNDGSLTNITTPYGTNFFQYYEDPNGNLASTNNAGGHLLVNRAIRVTDANAGKHLYMFRYDSTDLVQSSFPSSQIPGNQDDITLPIGKLDTGGTSTNSLTFRNSFYWNPKTEPNVAINSLSTLTAANYSKARWRHWLVENNDVVVTTSSALSFERLGAPSNSSTGAVVWLDYDGKTFNEKVDVQHRPGLIAAKLENGETTFQRFIYNGWGFVGSIQSTYRPAGGVTVETTSTDFNYFGDVVTDKVYDVDTAALLATVTYTNLFLQNISVDSSVMWSFGTYSGFTNTLEVPDGIASNKRITTVGRFPQPRFTTNALNETSLDVAYGEKRRLEAIFTQTGLREFKYFTNGADIGKLRSVVENSVSETQFTYATNGTLASITTPLGLNVTTVFDYLYRPREFDFPAQTGSHSTSTNLFSYTLASGTNPTGGTNILDVTKVTDRHGNDTKYEYTPLRVIKRITDRENRITDFLYSCSCGALDSISNSLQVVSFDYDLQSHLTGITYPDLTRVQYDYDSYGQLKRISESVTNFLAISYNNQGLLSAVSNQFGAAWIGGYNSLGHLTRVTKGELFSLGIDKLGRQVSTAYRDGSAWVTNQTWGFAAGIFQATRHTNALGEVSFFDYDNFERLTSLIQTNLSTNTFGYNAAGQMTGFTNALGGKTFWGYDSEGRLTKKTNDVGATLVSYYYFPNGWVSNRVDANNNSVKYTYDKVGNLKTNSYLSRYELFTYDAMNRLTGMTDSVGAHAFSYLNGFLSTEDGPWASDTLTFQYSHLLRRNLNVQSTTGSRNIGYGYDEAGRLKSVVSPAGAFTYEYQTGAFAAQPGLFQNLNLPGGGKIANSFDHPLGFLTRTALRTPVGGESLANKYDFDLAGRLRTAFHSDLTKTVYDYYPHGALTSALGQTTNGTSLPEQSLGYKFDPDGNLITRTNVALIQNLSTNKLNRITSVAASGTITVSGAASPNTTSVTVNGVAATLNADKTFYKASVPATDPTFTAVATSGSFSATDTVVNSWGTSIMPTYDAYGNLKTVGGRIFTYDEENRLSTCTVASGSDNSQTEYVYDGLGRLRVKRVKPGQSGPFVTGQTLGSLRSNYSGWVGFAFTVGEAPMRVTHLGRWKVSGNSGSHSLKIVKASDGSDVATASVNTSTGSAGQYLYAALPSTVVLAPNTSYCLISQETNGGDQWYDIDTTITTTTVATPYSVVYTTALPSLNLPGYAGNSYVPVSLKYLGASFGTATSETRYVYDGNLVVEERDANNQTIVQYTRGADLSGELDGVGGIGGLLARTDSGAHSYYEADRAGNILTLSDSSGNLKAQYAYEPFGRTTTANGVLAEANHYQFSSREYDAVTGLYYFGGRFYDPGLQRWLNPDPAGEAGGANLYSFNNNSPPNFIDPNGFAPQLVGFNYNPANGKVSPQYRDGKFGQEFGMVNPNAGAGAGLAMAAGNMALTMVPGVGEAQDAAVIMDSESAWWERLLSTASLAANALTEGLAPNIGGVLRRGNKHCIDVPKRIPCFSAGTKVSTPDGDRNIEEIKVGDTVYAYDFQNREVKERKVRDTPKHFTYYWVEIEINGEIITATRKHLFWIESERCWIEAADLKEGMIVRLREGEFAAINAVSLRELETPERTYNLIVEGEHNYFVSQHGVLVHNGYPESPQYPPPTGVGENFQFNFDTSPDYERSRQAGVRRARATGQFPPGGEMHHSNSVQSHPHLSAEPDNFEWKADRKAHLDAHGGDWKNPTSGKLRPGC